MKKELYTMLETMALAEVAKAKMSLHILGEIILQELEIIQQQTSITTQMRLLQN